MYIEHDQNYTSFIKWGGESTLIQGKALVLNFGQYGGHLFKGVLFWKDGALIQGFKAAYYSYLATHSRAMIACQMSVLCLQKLHIQVTLTGSKTISTLGFNLIPSLRFLLGAPSTMTTLWCLCFIPSFACVSRVVLTTQNVGRNEVRVQRIHWEIKLSDDK